MKQFTIKFTEDNWCKHLNHNPDVIITLRDAVKGDIGDVTILKNGIYILINCYEVPFCDLIIDNHYDALWAIEGFSSKDEYLNEIKCIYGSDTFEKLDKKAYIHTLLKLKYREFNRTIRNPVTGTVYPIRSHSSKELKNEITGLWSDPHD
ncbi:MAG: hypothetical protein M0R51_14645 [Clostridia bacterium]|jgi:hypothetical protein|nr:hypothetical protein [Clostridia bacterium]